MHIGRVFGIPLGVSYSWFIIFALVTVSLAAQFSPLWSPETRWTAALVTSLLFFGSVLGHELAHSVVALSFGIPVKGITLFIFGGVSQIAREATKPRVEALIAVVGPLMSLALAGLFYGLQLVADPVSETLAAMTGWLAVINLNLAVFNLIPGFPLDGGRVLRAILWWVRRDYRSATRIAVTVGRVVAWTFIVGGAVSALGASLIANLTGVKIGLMGGVWIAFIGWFLDNAATSTYSQMVLRESLTGYTARDVMTRDLPMVSRSTTLRRVVDESLLLQDRRFLLVGSNGVLDGIITLRNIKAVPRERWDSTLASDVMTPLDKMKYVAPQDDALSVLERMDEADVNQLPVVDRDMVVGVVARDRLLHIIRLRSELK
ncbi:MAG: site-2 protease family protein [Dehalococcoidia bacterium]|nr:site-2 protease family protein [Dehalococcoidia bacterium]